jgi:hypothetical protein
MKSKKQRREEADLRTEAHLHRKPEEQIQILDKKLGKGVGAKKEREKLNKLISNNRRNSGQHTKNKT